MRRKLQGFVKLVAGVAAVAALTACSEQVNRVTEGADRVAQGASTARACASILSDLASIGGEQPSAADVADGAERLSETAAGAESATLQDAAGALAGELREIAAALEVNDVAQAERTLQDAADEIREVASTCGLPVGEVDAQLGLDFSTAAQS